MPKDKSKPAVAGGAPVRRALLPYGRQSISPADKQAVLQVLSSAFLTTGPKVAEFEKAVARYARVDHAVAMNSGTAALHAAVAALGTRPGDEFLCPPITFAASANAARYCGGTVRFVDVDSDGNISLRALERFLALNYAKRGAYAAHKRSGKPLRAVMAVHYAGRVIDMKRLASIVRPYRAAVIEDACHALGAVYAGGRVGGCRWSDMTVFSFHPVKAITTGEGGMVTTRSKQTAAFLKSFRNHGLTYDHNERSRQARPYFYAMEILGYNYRLTDLQCALGLSQLKALDSFVRRRRSLAEFYCNRLRGIPSLTLPALPSAAKTHAWHLFPVLLNLETLTVDRDQVVRALRAENIGVNVHYIPVHWHPYYRALPGGKTVQCPVAEDFYAREVSLPLFPAMTRADAQDVVDALRKVLGAYAR